MGTLYSVPINLFLKRVEKDINFFNYFNLDDIEAMELANERAMTYLGEAIGRVMLECQPTVDFTDANDELQSFNFDFSAQEKLVIPSLMYEYYLNRNIAYLALQSVDYTPTELRVFDKSNARKSFIEMYDKVCKENERLLEEYRNRNRTTGAFVGIDYTKNNIDGNE